MSEGAKSERPSFEEALERLEEIAGLLDSGGMSLDDSLELFGEAIGLVRVSREILDDAEGRIEELMELHDEVVERIDLELE